MVEHNERINLDEIDKDGPQSYSRTLTVSPSELGRDEVVAIGPMSIDAQVQKGSRAGEYLVDGVAKFTADLTCLRCLEPYPLPALPFHLRFQPRPGRPAGRRRGNRDRT
jgi:uncharacterized metal-binding protein YceD (DUF177 family)